MIVLEAKTRRHTFLSFTPIYNLFPTAILLPHVHKVTQFSEKNILLPKHPKSVAFWVADNQNSSSLERPEITSNSQGNTQITVILVQIYTETAFSFGSGFPG